MPIARGIQGPMKSDALRHFRRPMPFHEPPFDRIPHEIADHAMVCQTKGLPQHHVSQIIHRNIRPSKKRLGSEDLQDFSRELVNFFCRKERLC